MKHLVRSFLFDLYGMKFACWAERSFASFVFAFGVLISAQAAQLRPKLDCLAADHERIAVIVPSFHYGLSGVELSAEFLGTVAQAKNIYFEVAPSLLPLMQQVLFSAPPSTDIEISLKLRGLAAQLVRLGAVNRSLEDVLPRLSPLAASIIIEAALVPNEVRSGAGLESLILAASGKTISQIQGIESPEDYLTLPAVISDKEWRIYFDSLMRIIACDPCRKEFEGIALEEREAFVQNDYQKISRLRQQYLDMVGYDALNAVMVTFRTKSMAIRIRDITQASMEGSLSVFVVGAYHFFGQNGLVNNLLKFGFSRCALETSMPGAAIGVGLKFVQ